MNTTEAYISHVLPGRVRLKIPSRRGDAAFFADVAQRLEQCEGVNRVRATPITASLLIIHTTSLDAIGAWASQQQLFSLPADAAESLPRPRNLQIPRNRPRAALPPARDPDERRARLISTSLAGLGALQTIRGQIFGPAITLFWYAYDARRGRQSPAAGTTSSNDKPS